jgi:hypothetical protein
VPRVLPVLLVAAALAGCGDDETVSAPSPTPEATAVATDTPTPTPTATESATPTATEQPAPEDTEGGAGDEEAARVPAAFTVDAAGVHPPQVAVPAFLAIELSVQNGFASPITVRLEGAEPFRVTPYATEVVQLDGRRPGRFVIDFGRGKRGLLVTGAEPGP